jgi:hypothetical protein
MEISNKYKIKNKIWIEADIFYSEAFRRLSKSAILTLMRCFQKRKWEKGKGRKKIKFTNEGFAFPYTEAIGLKIAKGTQHWKNMGKLVEVGFLDVYHQGGWYQKKENDRDCSIYLFSERWRDYGTPAFEKVEKPKVLQPDFYIRANIARKELKVTSQTRRGHLHKSEGDRGKSDNSRLHECEADKTTLENRQTIAATI